MKDVKTFTKCQLPCGKCKPSPVAVPLPLPPSPAAPPSLSPPPPPPPPPPSPAPPSLPPPRRRRRHRRALPCAAAPFAAAEPCAAEPCAAPSPSPAPSLAARCSLPCLATRSTALAADLLKFDKAKRKAAGPNTRRVTCSAPYCHPRHKTTRRAGPQLSVKRQSMAELAGGTTLGLGGAPERPRCVVLQRVNGLVGAPKPQAAGGRY